jgi:hypothetical protein
MKAWFTRGTRPARNMEAAVVGALLSYVDAVARKKPQPGIHAFAGGVASAAAMNEHLVANRAAANERNGRLATAIADLASKFAGSRPHRELK